MDNAATSEQHCTPFVQDYYAFQKTIAVIIFLINRVNNNIKNAAHGNSSL